MPNHPVYHLIRRACRAARYHLAWLILLATAPVLAQPLGTGVSALSAMPGVRVSAPASWVAPAPRFDSALETRQRPLGGLRYRVADQQINASTPGATEFYQGFEVELSSVAAVEDSSLIEIDFDPTYERLILHNVTIERDGQEFDKLADARSQLLQRERELDALIYDGTRTVSLVLNDVRVGDRLHYAYTIEGDNPIFKGKLEFHVRTRFGVALDLRHVRVLAPLSRPLHVRQRHVQGRLLQTPVGDMMESRYVAHHVPAYEAEDGTPSWRQRFGVIVFSELADWKSVTTWASPMYSPSLKTPDELLSVASGIRATHSTDRDRIGAALRWVQNDIRYFGVELGVNSHQPRTPEETLRNRFGDCKDKTVLLIALLDELGIEAQPALVNSKGALRDSLNPYRLHAFDHVIVHLQHQGRSHWLDPTRNPQTGALGVLDEPDFGQALVLGEGSNTLTSMANARSGFHKTVDKHLTIHNDVAGSVELRVETRLRGGSADGLRRRIDDVGLARLTRDYEHYYRRQFPGLERLAPVVASEGKNGELLLVESYRIHDFWRSDGDVDSYQWLQADEVEPFLLFPDSSSDRQEPYAIKPGVTVEETWHVSLPYRMRVMELEASYQTPHFVFDRRHTQSADGRELMVRTRYQSQPSEVPAADVQSHAAAVRSAREDNSFYLEHHELAELASRPLDDAQAEGSVPENTSPRLAAASNVTAADGLARAGRVHPLMLLFGGGLFAMGWIACSLSYRIRHTAKVVSRS